MTLRTPHGRAAELSLAPRIEVLPPDELPIGVQAAEQVPSTSERKQGGTWANGARTDQSKGGRSRAGATRPARRMPWKECDRMDERLRFVARLLDGEKMAPLCRSFGISRKTGYKIFERYKEMGLDGLTDRSRRPYRHANQLPLQLEKLIVALKKEQPTWGAPDSCAGDRTMQLAGPTPGGFMTLMP